MEFCKIDPRLRTVGWVAGKMRMSLVNAPDSADTSAPMTNTKEQFFADMKLTWSRFYKTVSAEIYW
jgi:hypothetical protein